MHLVFNTENLWRLQSAFNTWEIKLKTIFKHSTNSKIHHAFKKSLEK